MLVSSRASPAQQRAMDFSRDALRCPRDERAPSALPALGPLSERAKSKRRVAQKIAVRRVGVFELSDRDDAEREAIGVFNRGRLLVGDDLAHEQKLSSNAVKHRAHRRIAEPLYPSLGLREALLDEQREGSAFGHGAAECIPRSRRAAWGVRHDLWREIALDESDRLDSYIAATDHRDDSYRSAASKWAETRRGSVAVRGRVFVDSSWGER